MGETWGKMGKPWENIGKLVEEDGKNIQLSTKVAKSPRREVVRSSVGAGVLYPPFLGPFA